MAETIDEAWLRERDLRRHDEAKAVLRELQAVVHDVPEKHAAFYCAVLGSTYRMLDRLDHARDSLRLGSRIADDQDDQRARANLLQRRAYVEHEMLRPDRALDSAERAFAAYHFLGDEEGKGQTLVDRGLFLGYLKRTDEAIDSYTKALEHLSDDSHLNRFSLHQSLARLLGLQKRDYDQARLQIEKAREHLPHLTNQRHSRAKLLWLQASLDRSQRRFEAASGKLLQVVEALADFRPLDAVLAGLEMAETQFLLGGPVLAYSAVMGLRRFVEKLEDTPTAQAGVQGLIELEKRSLTIERIRQTRRTVIKSRGAPRRPV